MPYSLHSTEEGLILELTGGLTARHVADLAGSLGSCVSSGSNVSVRASDVADVDTSILQLLVSLRKTSAAFAIDEPSDAFINAVDRCALRRELLSGVREVL
jgi:ABC-type transporter Mla MlaB component